MLASGVKGQEMRLAGTCSEACQLVSTGQRIVCADPAKPEPHRYFLGMNPICGILGEGVKLRDLGGKNGKALPGARVFHVIYGGIFSG